MAPPLSWKIVKWLNQTYTLRESPKRFTKDGMRLHEISCLSERDNQSVFFIHKLRSPKEERMSWTLHNFSLYLIVAQKTCIYFILGRCLHLHAFRNSCFTSGYESIDFSLYTNFQNPIAWFIGLNILCFMFQKTTMSSALCFQRVKCLQSFTLSKTTMS